MLRHLMRGRCARICLPASLGAIPAALFGVPAVMATGGPVVTTTGTTTSYYRGTTATAVEAAISVTDSDSATLVSATVSIGSGFDAPDTLSFANPGSGMGDIAGAYNPVDRRADADLGHARHGHPVADGPARGEVPEHEHELRQPDDRLPGLRRHDDGRRRHEDGRAARPRPLHHDRLGSAAFTGGDNGPAGLVAIDNNLTVTDPRGLALTGAVVQITGNYHSDQDLIGFTNNNASSYGNIAATFDSTAGTLTMSSASNTASVTQWKNALRAVYFTNTAVAPDTSLRTVTMTVTDALYSGVPVSRTVTVTGQDQTPIVTTTGTTVNYIAGRLRRRSTRGSPSATSTTRRSPRPPSR